LDISTPHRLNHFFHSGKNLSRFYISQQTQKYR
jgi:hypothetical protein